MIASTAGSRSCYAACGREGCHKTEATHPHGAVTIRTLRAGDRASIEVEDECGGLPPGTAEAMFAPHESHDTDRSRLGLAICRRGVDAIGGRLSVRDLPGKGCVFAIDLPVAT